MGTYKDFIKYITLIYPQITFHIPKEKLRNIYIQIYTYICIHTYYHVIVLIVGVYVGRSKDLLRRSGRLIGSFKGIHWDNKETVQNIYRDRFPNILGLDEGIKKVGVLFPILRKQTAYMVSFPGLESPSRSERVNIMIS